MEEHAQRAQSFPFLMLSPVILAALLLGSMAANDSPLNSSVNCTRMGNGCFGDIGGLINAANVSAADRSAGSEFADVDVYLNITQPQMNESLGGNGTAPPDDNLASNPAPDAIAASNATNPADSTVNPAANVTNTTNAGSDSGYNLSSGSFIDVDKYMNSSGNATNVSVGQAAGANPLSNGSFVDINSFLNISVNGTGAIRIDDFIGFAQGQAIAEGRDFVAMSDSGKPAVAVSKEVYSRIKNNRTARIIVRYKQAPGQDAKSMLSSDNASYIPSRNLAVLDADVGRLKGLLDSGAVAIYPDARMSVSLNDSIPLIEADRAQNELNITGRGVGVCLLDTGVDLSKVPNVVSGYDFINNDSNSMDDNGHGTFMASVIHAVAPDAAIVAVKVLGSDGTGYSSDIIRGVEYCRAHMPDYNIRVLSMSFGGGNYSDYCAADPVAMSADDAFAGGMLVSSSAGNDGAAYITAPACGPDVTAVSSTSKSDSISSFSDMNGMVDLLAPGESITATGLSGNETRSGTSISAAHVSGAAALLFQSEPSLAPADAENRFKTTGSLIESNGANYTRIDAYNALLDIVTGAPTNQSVNSTNATWGYPYSAEYTSDYNAIIAYRSNTGANLLLSPKIRFWNSSGTGTWGAEIVLPSAGSAVQWAKVRWSTVSSKIVVVTLSADGYLDGYVCMANCTTVGNWTYTSNIGSVANAPAQRRFDMDFETSTGNLVLVYGVNDTSTTHDLAYKVLPAATTSFSGLTEQYIDDTGHATDIQYTWVRTARKPGASKEIGLIGFDSTDNDINAWIWNGAAWGNQVSISDTATSTGGYETLAIRYAADGSKALVMGDDAVATRNIVYGYWNGTGWSAMTTYRFALGSGNVQWLNIKADPATDDMQAVITTTTPSLYTAYWSGTAMTFSASIDAGLDIATRRCADFDWNGTTSTGVLVWDTDGVGTTLSQRACSPQCTGATSTISTYAGTGAWVTLYRNVLSGTQTDKILGARLNSAFDIGSFRYDGAAYTNYGDTAITAATTVSTYEAYDLDYNEIDTVVPSVNFTTPTPANNTLQNISYVYVNVSASDNIALSNVILEWDGLNHSMTQGTGTNWYLNETGLADGNYSYKVYAVDVAGNINVTDTRNVTIDTTPPNIAQNFPSEGYSTNTTTINFNFTATDALSSALNCSLYLDGTLNQTNATTANNTATNFSVSSIASGAHTWYVKCLDRVNNSNSSATRNFTVDTTPPSWSNPQKNETTVYWNQSVTFNTSWTDNVRLSGYIFSTNQSGSWVNSSFTAFGGASNVSQNISIITASAGTNVSWYFWANDTAGNSNQTANQSFVVQSRPTSLAFGVDQSTYPQGKSPGGGYDIYIPFQARYLDSLTGQPVSGGTCYVTNSETLDNVTLAYNSSTGNFTGNVTDYMMYDTVGFNASCSAANYIGAANSTNTNVWFFAYLWEWGNTSYGSGNEYTTHWLRKEPANGSLYTLTNELNLSAGSNLVGDFPYCGVGTNCSFMKDYLMGGLYYLRANLSLTSGLSASCSPYLCYALKDFDLNLLDEACLQQQSVPAGTPTQIESNMTYSSTVAQGDYIFLRVYLNCTSASAGNLSIYYNYTGQAANIEIHSPNPTQIQSYIAAWAQLESIYPVGPNQTANMTRKWWVTFNNTDSSPRYTVYFFIPQILSQYPDRNINNTIYVYNSTSGLWASDNASAGAPNVATSYSDNRVSWTTETVPGNTAKNETLQRGILNAIIDNESLVSGNAFQKVWNVNVYDVFFPVVTIYNVSAWTNYSAYGVPGTWSFNVTMTQNGNTTDITGQTINNQTAGTLTFPLANVSAGGVAYTITATSSAPPNITFVPTTPDNGTYRNANWAYINVTSDQNLSSAALEWNGTNESMSGSLANWFKNKTGLADGVYTYKVYGNDTYGNLGVSETRTITIDTAPPVITFVNQTPDNGSIRDVNWAYINITSNENLSAAALEWNGTNATMNGSGTDWHYNKTGLSFGAYAYKVYGNDSANNWGVSETRTLVYSLPPSLIILSPLGEAHYQTARVSLSVNATDPFGIDKALAQVAYPNGSMSNFTLYHAQQSDDFSNNTLGTDWFKEDVSIGPSQTCIADINTTYAGKAFTSLSGNGGPEVDTYCSLISAKPLDGDFDINISFNITGESGSDNSLYFSAIERNSSATADEYVSISLSNWTCAGESCTGRDYEIYMAGENFSDYVYTQPTNDSYGKLRIVRSGDLFSFYIWNNTDNSWYLANSTSMKICRPLYVSLDSESALPGWGSMNVTWDDFGASGDGALFRDFGDTLQLGLYNVTFFVNNTLGAMNDTQKTNFTVIFENQPPTKPFIYLPTIGSVLNGMQNIVWSPVYDYENDSLNFNITLLNPDGSDNATIVSNYGNTSSASYPWDATAFPDGQFSIRVTVFENTAPEHLSNSYTLHGTFTINNHPPSVIILSPLGESHYQTGRVSLSVNATDPFGIDKGLAQVTYPNGSMSNFTLYHAQQSDDFSNNTIGTNWFTENVSIGPSQTCVADIDTTYLGKAFTSLSGNGGPETNTFCPLISAKPLDGDFDINISFNITGETGPDNALIFVALEGNSSASAVEYVFMSLTNWSGEGKNYEIYAAGENFSDYIYMQPTNDTYGKFRMVRSGDLFSFYIWNNTGNSWYFANSTSIAICRPLYSLFASESALPTWGSMNVTWDDFGASGDGALFRDFGDTLQLGLYNVTFFVNNTLGAMNDTQKTNFTVFFKNQPPSKPFVFTPSIGAVLNGTQSITWLTVHDYENDSLNFNITLLNPDGSDNATIIPDYGNISSTSYPWDTATVPNGVYSIRVTVFENGTPEHLSNSYTLPGTFYIDRGPSVTILFPHGENYLQRLPVSISANITAAFGISSAIAQVTLPNGSAENMTLGEGQQGDNFDNDTMGTDWAREDVTTGPSQTCFTDIDTSIAGEAYTSLSGDGSPRTDTRCSIISSKAIGADFDINISFEKANAIGENNALYLMLSATPSAATPPDYLSIAVSNMTGYGPAYSVFVQDGNFSSLLSYRPSTDTYGKLRITRVGNNFTFYSYNNSDSSWLQEAVYQNGFSQFHALYAAFGTESGPAPWGTLGVAWDNFSVTSANMTLGMFNDTSLLGLYNVSLFVNDTYGRRNDSERTNFTIVQYDIPPSVPYILSPSPGEHTNGTYDITWSDVTSQDGDPVRFNITLLNPDYTYNATIVSDYGNLSSNNYAWNTSAYPDGNYSMRITVFENESAEYLSNSFTLLGNFSLDNFPPGISFVPPTETSGSIKFANNINVNVTAYDPNLNVIEIWLYNSSGALINESSSGTSPLFIDFTNLSAGLYFFNASALDVFGHVNSTETRNVTIFSSVISNVSAAPSPNGFGFNVTIQANISDPSSVLVGVTPPGGNETNYTMANISGSVYAYNFSAWTNGTYLYTIYASDSYADWVNSSAYNFTLFQNLSIQVKTLQDYYLFNQTINITDPEFVNEDAPAITDASFNGSAAPAPAKAPLAASNAMQAESARGVPISAHVTDKWGVTRVTATVPTQNGSDSVPLELSSGTANDGIWQGVWQPHDLLGEHYIVLIRAENTKHMNETDYLSVGDPPGVWIDPSGDDDPTGLWTDRFNARDGDTHTYAQDNSNPGNGWGTYIYFNVSKIVSDRARIWADWGAQVDSVEIDVTNGTSWVQAYQGPIPNLQWFQANYSIMNVTGGRFRYHYNTGGWIYWLYEFQFYNVSTQVNVPVIATQPATSVDQDTAVLHAVVSSDGGDICQVRFLYGNSTSYANSTPWTTGMFTGNALPYRLYGLQPGQTYHYIAQINNSAGESNGSDQFFTAGPPQAGWLAADGYDDPTGTWVNGLNAFDDDLVTEASEFHDVNDPRGVWSPYLYLNETPPISSRRIRFNAKATDVAAAEVDLLVNGSWITIFNGPFTDSAWTEVVFNLTNASQARIAFEATANNRGFEFRLAEFDFFNSPLTAVENQSKLENWGPTNASCYLFMKTQYWNGSAWLGNSVVVNETTPRVLTPTDVLKLDTIWNPNNYTTNSLSFGNGVYRVYAACLDNESNVLMQVNGSYVNATYNFTYDTISPTVVIVSPANGTNYTLGSTIPIKVNATDPYGVSSVFANVSTPLGSELVALTYNSTSGLWETGYLNTFYVTAYTISIIATDNAGNINNNESAWVNVIDTIAPSVVLVSPPNGFANDSATSMNVTFSCNATDNYDTHNISLYITDSNNNTFALNGTVDVSGVYTHANFTLNLSAGSYTWNCLAYDSSGNYAWAPANWTLSITSPVFNCPVITSPGTYNQTQDYFGAPNNASPLSGFACVLINASNVIFDCHGYTITNNGTAGTTYGVLLHGPLTNVTLRDCPGISNYSYGAYAYYSNQSALSNITAFNNTQYGFYLNSSPDNTLSNDTAYGNAGGAYLANSTSNGISGNNLTNNTGIGIGFDTSSGSNSLSLNRVCYNNASDVSNPSASNSSGSYDYCGLWNNWAENNHSGCEFSCSYVWHEFFGNLSGRKLLAPNNAQIFYSWLWNGQHGKVYAIRGGASINWANITALGRNTGGSNTSNDFTALDSLLNMTGKPDSIRSLYSSDGSNPLLTNNVSVYYRNVAYVPVANSSTASAAKTGITWDGSQGVNGYFNSGDNQDVVFVNEINSSQQYNYMIRVPSGLATYKGGSTVQFWAELD